MASLPMRTIQVSTNTFAAIWADRREGEGSEDEIIGRKFGVKPAAASAPFVASSQPRLVPSAGVGYIDQRSGTVFPEGSEIFRRYKGTEYRAKATMGSWLLMNTGDTHSTLNRLSDAIGAHEDAWHGWRYRDEKGRVQLINKLRDQKKISRRNGP